MRLDIEVAIHEMQAEVEALCTRIRARHERRRKRILPIAIEEMCHGGQSPEGLQIAVPLVQDRSRDIQAPPAKSDRAFIASVVAIVALMGALIVNRYWPGYFEKALELLAHYTGKL